MTRIHQWRKMNFYSLIPCFIDHIFLVSDFGQLLMLKFSPIFPFLHHCCLCIWNFHCLRHRNELVNKTVMSHRTRSFRSDVILMRFVYSSLDPWSCALVGINNTSKSCLAFPRFAVGLPTAIYWYFASHCCWHRNFLLSSSGFDYELEFFIVWFDEVYWPLHCLALSSFSFSIAHLCCDICVHTSGHTSSGREVVYFLVSLLPDHVYPSGGLSFKKMNLVNPVHASDYSFSPSTFQSSSICFPTLRLVRKMLFW